MPRSSIAAATAPPWRAGSATSTQISSGGGAAGEQVLDLAGDRLRLGALVARSARSASCRARGSGARAATASPLAGGASRNHAVAEPPSASASLLERVELVRVVAGERLEHAPAGPGSSPPARRPSGSSKRSAISPPHVGPLDQQAVEGEEDVAAVEAAGTRRGCGRGRCRARRTRARAGPPRASASSPALAPPRGRARRASSARPVRPSARRSAPAAGPAARPGCRGSRGGAAAAGRAGRAASPAARPGRARRRRGRGRPPRRARAAAARRSRPSCRSRAPRRALEQRLAAFAQAPRGGPGGADHQHPLGRGAVGGQPRQAPRQQLGLAGPGGAEDQQRPVAVGDRALALAVAAGSAVGGLVLAHRSNASALRSIRPMDVFSADWPANLPPHRGRPAGDLRRRRASSEERTVYEGVGEGGDHTLVIDRRCEDVVFAELETLAAAGRLLRRRLRGARRGRLRLRRRGAGGDRPDRRLAQRPPHDPLRTASASPSPPAPRWPTSSSASSTTSAPTRSSSPAAARARRSDGAPVRVAAEAEQLEVVGLESAEPEWALPALRGAGRQGLPAAGRRLDRDHRRLRRRRPLRRDAEPALLPLGRRRRGAADRPRGGRRGRLRRPRALARRRSTSTPATRSPPPAARPALATVRAAPGRRAEPV